MVVRRLLDLRERTRLRVYVLNEVGYVHFRELQKVTRDLHVVLHELHVEVHNVAERDDEVRAHEAHRDASDGDVVLVVAVLPGAQCSRPTVQARGAALVRESAAAVAQRVHCGLSQVLLSPLPRALELVHMKTWTDASTMSHLYSQTNQQFQTEADEPEIELPPQDDAETLTFDDTLSKKYSESLNMRSISEFLFINLSL